MTVLEVARINLTSPPVLAFGAGFVAALFHGTVAFPRKLYTALSAFLLAAIGFKGGVALAQTSPAAIWRPALATLALGVVTPIAAYAILRRLGRFGVSDAAAIAAHYGSVSAVTFTAAVAFLHAAGVASEGFLPTLVAILEIPAIAIALLIAHTRGAGNSGGWGAALREILTGRSILLLGGGLLVGAAIGVGGLATLPPSFTWLFFAALTVFLLEMGITAARRIGDLRTAGPFLAAFAVVVPLLQGVAGVLLGTAAGLSLGGSTLFGVMAASASYIAAPAAVRVSLPDANPSYYLTAALGITFPFNLTIGIPVYYAVARMMH